MLFVGISSSYEELNHECIIQVGLVQHTSYLKEENNIWFDLVTQLLHTIDLLQIKTLMW